MSLSSGNSDNEVTWDWQEIFMMLLFRVTPKGFFLLKEEIELPRHSVLIENREKDHLNLKFVTLETAKAMQGPIATAEPKVPVKHLEGRWMKLVVCYLWKYRRDGIRLTQADWDAVPDDRMLELRPYRDGLEYVPVKISDAIRIAKEQKDHKGIDLL